MRRSDSKLDDERIGCAENIRNLPAVGRRDVQ